MFKRILIANRGEIACRVMTTARELGVETVAVFSDADAGSKHVALADQAVRIGPAPVAESYLRIDRIVEAARLSGAEAIHPGYGFLSENPDFVEAVEAEGLVFIGPSARAIRAMGLKDAAKALMEKTGVPVVPGYHGDRQDVAFLRNEADRIGYPVLIKARAGGGGKGMRLVEAPEDFADALAGAKREGQASFGDPACLIEKYITKPRHIEIQVFGDHHGNVVHLFERDCSLQRRHQKVIEEAPAPDMPDAVRDAMGSAAVSAAQAIGYRGAGTIEFIADGSGALRPDGFWFMEMNTRLQVEHPVTEAITGMDLVALQLRVASGDPLPFTQDDLAIDGHAFEARVYAEDAARGFLPAIGRLDRFATPPAAEFAPGKVRIDAGVREGDEITPHYDPMIAKVIVHGPTRRAALNQLSAALERVHVTGCVTNVAFLSALARHEGFGSGDVDTGLIARDLEALVATPKPDDTVLALVAIAALRLCAPRPDADPWSRLVGWRQWSAAEQTVSFSHRGERLQRTVVIQHADAAGLRVTVKTEQASVDLSVAGEREDILCFTVDQRRRHARVVDLGTDIVIFIDGHSYAFQRQDPFASEVEGDASGDVIIAPMPGLVRTTYVKADDVVSKGDAIALLEAMKMEYALKAPRDGVVQDVLAREGDQVTDGAVLVRLRPEAEDD